MSKKLIFLALFLALTFPSPTSAQTFSLEQEIQIKAIIQQITDLQIQLLLARIAELQAQIAELIAKQNVVEQKVDTVITNTMPKLGSTPVPIPVPTVSIGEAVCYDNHLGTRDKTVYMVGKVPVTITGVYTKGIAKIDQQGSGGGSHYGILFFLQSQTEDMPFHNLDEGTYDYTITLSGDFGSVEYSGTFSVPICKV